MSFEIAFKKVAELVNDFKSNENYFSTAKMQLHQAKTEGDKNYLDRKCERLDKEIDQLACLAVRQVYQLYSLTADEIKIVEGEKKV